MQLQLFALRVQRVLHSSIAHIFYLNMSISVIIVVRLKLVPYYMLVELELCKRLHLPDSLNLLSRLLLKVMWMR